MTKELLSFFIIHFLMKSNYAFDLNCIYDYELIFCHLVKREIFYIMHVTTEEMNSRIYFCSMFRRTTVSESYDFRRFNSTKNQTILTSVSVCDVHPSTGLQRNEGCESMRFLLIFCTGYHNSRVVTVEDQHRGVFLPPTHCTVLIN